MEKLKRTMRLLSVLLPIVVLTLLFIHVVHDGLSKSYVVAGAMLFLWSGLLSRFFHGRSKGLEASFFYVRVSESDWDPLDWIAIAGAGVLVLIALLLPLIRQEA